MFHVGELAHQGRMLLQFLAGADHQLVQHLAGVDDTQAHGLALAHLDAVRGEAHVVRHADVDGAARVLGVAGDAPGLLLLHDGLGGMVAAAMGRVGQAGQGKGQQGGHDQGSLLHHPSVSRCQW